MPPNLSVCSFTFSNKIFQESAKVLANSRHNRSKLSHCLEMLKSSFIYFPGFVINGKVIYLCTLAHWWFLALILLSVTELCFVHLRNVPNNPDNGNVGYVHRKFIITVYAWTQIFFTLFSYSYWFTGNPGLYNIFALYLSFTLKTEATGSHEMQVMLYELHGATS